MSGEACKDSRLDPKSYEVHYADWKTIISIEDRSSGTQLYTLIKNHSGKGRLLNDASGDEVGTTNTHSMTTKIDVSIVGRSFEIADDKKWNGSPTYTSDAFGNQLMTWKHNSTWSSKIGYTLIDGKGLAVANFESNPKTKIGILEIWDGKVDSKEQMDETALVILTLLRRKMVNNEAATIATVG